MDLVVATRNPDKLKEIKILLKDLPIKVISLDSFNGVPVVKENGRTLEANAEKKAVQVSRYLKKLVIADDSSLEISSLGNKPGVYSARFSGKYATYASNNDKVLNLLKSLPSGKRKARFRCAIAVADKGKMVGAVEGECRGKIGFKSQGKSGFGYDPIFIPHGCKKTFAQLGMRRKNRISHRSKALVKAKKIITEYVEGLTS